MATTPGLLEVPPRLISGCQPLMVTKCSGGPRTSISVALPGRADDHGGSGFPGTHQPVDRNPRRSRWCHRVPAETPAGHPAGLDHADRRSRSARWPRQICWLVRTHRFGIEAQPVDHQPHHRLQKPPLVTLHRPVQCVYSGVPPNPDVAHHISGRPQVRRSENSQPAMWVIPVDITDSSSRKQLGGRSAGCRHRARWRCRPARRPGARLPTRFG